MRNKRSFNDSDRAFDPLASSTTVIAIANAASVRIGIRVPLAILWRHLIRAYGAFFRNLNIERTRFTIIAVRYHSRNAALHSYQ